MSAGRVADVRSEGVLLRRSLLGAAVGMAALQAAGAAPPRRTHALLVGAAQVSALPRRLWLRGPDHDVDLMRAALLERGVAAPHITTLAGGPAGAAVDGPPTAARIRAAMADLLGRIAPGDTVLLHLSGHGVRLPRPPGTSRPEADGWDEAFLPVDVLPWDAAQQRLPNALRDDDIGDWFDALVDAGARVWAIFDTCHAAGMARSEGRDFTRQRGVAGAELGIPAGPAFRLKALPPVRPIPLRLDGRVLAFAARAHETTHEEWLPRGGARARVHGIFTWSVVEALRRGVADAASLRSAVAQAYQRDGRVLPVPQVLGEGVLPRF